MRTGLTLAALLFFTLLLPAQERTVVRLSSGLKKAAVGEIELTADGPFYACFVRAASSWQELQIRFSADGERWEEWQQVNREPHNPELAISQQLFLRTDYRHFQLRAGAGSLPDGTEVHFYNPGFSEPAPAATPPLLLKSGDSCSCAQPSYRDRQSWCPSGNCPPGNDPTATTVTHLIVHHSAGTTVTSDWAAIVRAIWDFHVNGNYWDDIGYNWLVAPSGEIFEGRGPGVRGAHFCGANSGTAGICVMGTYTEHPPVFGALSALTDLLAWQSCKRDFDARGEALHSSSGLVLDRIAGHRQGCTTACPGDAFFPLFPALRNVVGSMQEGGCAGMRSPTDLVLTNPTGEAWLLTWLDHSDIEEGFRLQVSVNGGDWQLLGQLPANTVAYALADPEEQTEYRFRVTAVYEGIGSYPSNEVSLSVGTTSTTDHAGHQITLYPNPATDRLTLEWTSDAGAPLRIRLFDARGQQLQVQSQAVTPQSVSLSIGHLPAGLYLLEVQEGDRRLIRKWIRE